MRIGTLVLVLGLALSGSASGQTYNIHAFAGGGLPDGMPALTASLGLVRGVASDASGNVYAALEEYHVVVRRDAAGVLTRVAGNGTHGLSGDGGPATMAQLASPLGVAVDSAGNLYIADSLNHRVRKVSGGVITTVAGTGVPGYGGDNGPAAGALLSYPSGVAVDSTGTLYIVDYGNHRIRKVEGGVISTLAGTGTSGYGGDNGPASAAQLSYPEGVAADSSGNVYIADTANFRVRRVSEGVISTVAGDGVQGNSGDNGPATGARLTWPVGLAVDRAGNLYIADSDSQRIRRVSNGVITTAAGNGTAGYGGDNLPAVATPLNYPSGVATDPDGALYVADSVNYRIRKVLLGAVTTVAGSGPLGYNGDGGPALSALFSSPFGLAASPSGAVYLAEYNRHRIRRVVNGDVTTFAGNGTWGYGGDNGPAGSAPLNWPDSVAVDAADSLYIADSNNNRVRKVSGGIISTVAGDGSWGFSGDGGPALNAQLGAPAGVAVDSEGNLYIADSNNNRIRKVTDGIISTVAGDGTAGYGGDGSPAASAQLHGPRSVAVDSAGSLYIADFWNYRVRKVSNGTISTIAGYGTMGYSGDDGPATAARLGWTEGVAVDAAGRVYLTDSLSQRVRVLIPALATVSAASFASSSALAPGIIAAGYGSNLVSTVESAPPAGPLPLELAQTSVLVHDSAGVERTAPLWFVSPTQINYYIPEETALGPATVRVVRNSQIVASGTLQIESVAPGLFTMNANGQGVPAAQAVFVAGDGSQTRHYVFDAGCQVGACRPEPLDLGAGSEEVFLELYGTGIRGAGSSAAVTARIGGVDAPVAYSGAVTGMVGLDQVNLRLPRGLAGLGEVDVVLSVEGKTSNPVRIAIR